MRDHTSPGLSNGRAPQRSRQIWAEPMPGSRRPAFQRQGWYLASPIWSDLTPDPEGLLIVGVAVIADDQVEMALTGQIRETTTDCVAVALEQHMSFKLTRGGLAEQDDGIGLFLLPVAELVCRQEADGEDVGERTSTDRTGHGMMHSIHIRDAVVTEAEIAEVFQPAEPVIWLPEIGFVQDVAIGVENVQPAITVEVH